MQTKIKDSTENVKSLILEIELKLSTSIGLAKSHWEQYLKDCKQYIKDAEKPVFEVGETYRYGYIGDSNLFTRITITKVSKCFVTFETRGRIKRAKIHYYNGKAYIYPDGQYSMASTCYAEDKV